MSWEQAREFCKYCGGDLPLSDEWEIAARNLVADNQKKGTLYPWGNIYIPGTARTTNIGALSVGSPLPVCTAGGEKGDKNNKDVCDLGGNLTEFTRTLSPDRFMYILRGENYRDSGEIGALGFVYAGWAASEAHDPRYGFRCAYNDLGDSIEPSSVAYYDGGKYELGYPDDHRMHLFEQYYRKRERKLEYFVKEPRVFEDVGNFFIMSRKVTQREYEEFYKRTKGLGPWTKEVNEPRRVDHSPPKTDRPDAPVTGVSWYSAHAYCAWKNMRLPTAEEWERVSRGNTGNIFPWGNEERNIQDNSEYNRFMRKDTGPSHQLITSMWSDGPEWTRTPGWTKDDTEYGTRILKGLQDPKSPEVIDYTVTAALPLPPEERSEFAGFRCVKDCRPTLSEKLFDSASSRRLKKNMLDRNPD